jgi:Fe2+ transport system protein FeoA
MYLTDAKQDKTYKMINFEGQRCLREKLSSLGLHMSMKFKVLRNYGTGPIQIKVRETKLAINRGMCSIIEVEECVEKNIMTNVQLTEAVEHLSHRVHELETILENVKIQKRTNRVR